MAAPTLLDYAESTWTGTGTSETTDDLNWNASGDQIVVLGATEDNGVTLTTPTGTGITLSALSGLPTNTPSSAKGYGWAATASGDGNTTLTANLSGNNGGGLAAWAFSGSDGLGTPETNVGTGLTVSVTVAQDSSVVMVLADWSATADVTVDTTPAGGTIREATQVSGAATFLVVEWHNQSAGTRSYGVSNWAGTGTVTKVAVEVLGTAQVEAWVARIARTRAPHRPAQRRGEFLPLPPVRAAYPAPPVTSRRRPTAAVRRGELLSVPPAVVVQAAPGPWLPPHLTHRRTPAQARRGEWFQIRLVGAAPAAPTPAPPQIIEGRRPAAAPRRRGTFARVVAVVAEPPPKATGQRRRPRPVLRRGQFLPWWPQAAPPNPPPPSVPGFMTRRRTKPQGRRRGAYGVIGAGVAVATRGAMFHADRAGPEANPGDRAAGHASHATRTGPDVSNAERTSAAAGHATRTGPTMTGGS